MTDIQPSYDTSGILPFSKSVTKWDIAIILTRYKLAPLEIMQLFRSYGYTEGLEFDNYEVGIEV